MAYTAIIQRVEDGKLFAVPRADMWNQFSDGDYRCDCNRARLVNGSPEACGHTCYRVRITLPDGSVPYDEIGR